MTCFELLYIRIQFKLAIMLVIPAPHLNAILFIIVFIILFAISYAIQATIIYDILSAIIFINTIPMISVNVGPCLS